MERKTRIPTQKRALEKVEKIVDAAFKLFNEKGYFNTTTADIANESGVATGSVYAYFEDKKDIYIQVLRKINNNFADPTRDFWKNNKVSLDNADVVKEIFNVFLKLMVRFHNFSKTFHDDMESLKLIDEDIKRVYQELDSAREEWTKEIFNIIGIPFKSENDARIFLHYSIMLTDDVCHTILYDETVKDIDLYVSSCAQMLYSLLETTTHK